MEYSQKYCLVQLHSPLRIGSEFSSDDWPLHCTIAGVFAIDWTSALHAQFAAMLAEQRAFATKTTDIAFFGPEKTVKVRRLEMNPELRDLHEHVVAFIEQYGGYFKEPHYLHDDFVPHVTMRGDEPGENETIPFDTLALIDMFPNADHTRRKVIASLPLATSL